MPHIKTLQTTAAVADILPNVLPESMTMSHGLQVHPSIMLSYLWPSASMTAAHQEELQPFGVQGADGLAQVAEGGRRVEVQRLRRVVGQDPREHRVLVQVAVRPSYGVTPNTLRFDEAPCCQRQHMAKLEVSWAGQRHRSLVAFSASHPAFNTKGNNLGRPETAETAQNSIAYLHVIQPNSFNKKGHVPAPARVLSCMR